MQPRVPLRSVVVWGSAWLLIAAMSGCSERDSDPVQPSRAARQPASDGVRKSDKNKQANLDFAVAVSVEQALASAQRLFQLGRLDDADAKVGQILIAQPNHLLAQRLAAHIQVKRGDTAAAIAILDSAAANSSEPAAGLWSEAAELLASEGDLIGAIDRHGRHLRQSPSNDSLRRRLAGLQNEAGLRFDANENIRRLCRSGPVRFMELYCLMDPSVNVFAVSPAEHQESAKHTATLRPALDLLKRNCIREATECLQSSLLVKSRHPAAMSELGCALSLMGDDSEFLQWYSGREESWQRYPAFWLAIGNWLMRSGEHSRALQANLMALRLEPMSRVAATRSAESLDALGRAGDARNLRSRATLIKDLRELAMDVIEAPRGSKQSYAILSRELDTIGLPYEAFAWQFNGLSVFGQRSATEQAHKAGLIGIGRRADTSHMVASRLCDVDFVMLNLDSVDPGEQRSHADSEFGQVDVEVSASTPVFQNIAKNVGLNFQYLNASPVVKKNFLLHQALGGGVACLDFDLDGRVDVYAAQGASNPPSKKAVAGNLLSRNSGGQFVDVSQVSETDDLGYSMGLTAGDWNQDGFPDLFVGNMDVNVLLINQGDGTFVRQKPSPDWDDGIYTTGLAIADLSGDHLPDLVEISYVDDPAIFKPIALGADGTAGPLPGPLQFRAGGDRLFVNLGDGSAERSEFAEGPIAVRARPAMGLVVGDMDGDLSNEVFVANDQTANRYWVKAMGSRVRGASGFIDTAAIKGVGVGVTGLPLASMGVAVADFDLNGLADMHVTNFDDELSNHYVQCPSRMFVDSVVKAGLGRHSRRMLGFGAQAIDFDNNSVPDLIVGNGHIEDFRQLGSSFEMPTQLFISRGHRFELAEFSVYDPYWQEGHLSRACAVLDWNNDGKVDVLFTDLLSPLVLLDNRTESSAHWLQVRLVGTKSERDAIGARVELHFGGGVRRHFITTGDGYMCKNEGLVFAGLGESEKVTRMVVRWPSGVSQEWVAIKGNGRILVIEGQADIHRLR